VGQPTNPLHGKAIQAMPPFSGPDNVCLQRGLEGTHCQGNILSGKWSPLKARAHIYMLELPELAGSSWFSSCCEGAVYTDQDRQLYSCGVYQQTGRDSFLLPLLFGDGGMGMDPLLRDGSFCIIHSRGRKLTGRFSVNRTLYSQVGTMIFKPFKSQ